jgi:hypothetical protein
MTSFSFVMINMRRHNAVMHALLATNTTDDILFIQEPWFSQVGTAHCDSAINGKDILGGAASPKWMLAYPYFSETQCTKVMTTYTPTIVPLHFGNCSLNTLSATTFVPTLVYSSRTLS